MCIRDSPETERFAVQQFSVAGRGLDGVPDGVTKVQECADIVSFEFIRRDNRRFDRQTLLDEERKFRPRELPARRSDGLVLWRAWIVVVRLPVASLGYDREKPGVADDS